MNKLSKAKEYVDLKELPMFLDVCNKCYSRMSPVMEDPTLSDDMKILKIYEIGVDVKLF